MDKILIDDLIAKRPRVYGWLGFQKFLLWTFLILGIMLLINTAFIIASGLIRYSVIEETSRQIANKYHLDQKEVLDFLISWLAQIKLKVILYSFFLSVSFFSLSRYCQKIINRNRYILRLETEWGKLKRLRS